jgi:hypothetical protein
MSWMGMLRRAGIESDGNNVNIFRGALQIMGATPVGLGAVAVYPKNSVGTLTLVPADAAARVALICITVTEVFATANQPTFTFGEDDTVTKYSVAALLNNAALGKVFVLAGTLTANKKLIVTAVAATLVGTGALSVAALVLPAAP